MPIGISRVFLIYSDALKMNAMSEYMWKGFHAKDATIGQKGDLLDAEFFKDCFSITCIKTELFLFSVSWGATL
jgi:hypothetical protein